MMLPLPCTVIVVMRLAEMPASLPKGAVCIPHLGSLYASRRAQIW